ncbi:MAG: DUF4446 family protein [bacterium]
MNTDTTNIIIYSLIILAVILIAIIIRLEIRMKKLMRGKNGTSLEDAFNSMQGDISNLHDFQDDMEKYLTDVEKRLRRSIQAVETIRYNPFKGTGSGGNQSFATTLISEDGDGVVISSLYSREHVSVFSKPVKSHKSEFELTEEELDVLNKAKETLSR